MAPEAPTRLETFIQRVTAQRACIDEATARIRGREGIVLELGLGNGRTYDHLRHRLPEREIFVFERQVGAHPDCIPDAAHLIEGELRDTLSDAPARLPGRAVLVHADLGTADAERNAALFRWLGPALRPLLHDDAVVLADQRLEHRSYVSLPLPEGVGEGRYFYYRFVKNAEAP